MREGKGKRERLSVMKNSYFRPCRTVQEKTNNKKCLCTFWELAMSTFLVQYYLCDLTDGLVLILIDLIVLNCACFYSTCRDGLYVDCI